MKRATLITAIFFLMSAGQTWAGPIVGITFHSSGGASQWTNETSLGNTTNDLPDETGVNSGYSLTTSNPPVGGASVTVDINTIPTGNSNLGGINGNFFNFNTVTAILSGLQAGATYDVWVFVARGGDPIHQLVTITGAGMTSFKQDALRQQLMVNSMVGSSSENGIALQAVPEPATLGLLACGVVGLAAYDWRRRKLATV
jgi:hypothetical protein